MSCIFLMILSFFFFFSLCTSFIIVTKLSSEVAVVLVLKNGNTLGVFYQFW